MEKSSSPKLPSAHEEELGKARADLHELEAPEEEEQDVFASTEDGPAFRSVTV